MAASLACAQTPLHAPPSGDYSFGSLSKAGVANRTLQPFEGADPSVAADVSEALQWLRSSTPELPHCALMRTQKWVRDAQDEHISLFIHQNGAHSIAEMMGPYSTVLLQEAAMTTAAMLATAAPAAAEALAASAAPLLLATTLKAPHCSPQLFRAAADAVTALAAASVQAASCLGKTSIMAHLLGAIAEGASGGPELRQAVICAITALCTSCVHAQADFFFFGGVNAILQTLLRAEMGSDEVLAAVRLIAEGAAHTDECRFLIKDIGGIEVLVQVYRDAANAHDQALLPTVLWALACITYEHEDNLDGLRSAAKLLACPDVVDEVAALHVSQAPRLEAAAMKPSLSRTLSLESDDGDDGPLSRFSLDGAQGGGADGGRCSSDGRGVLRSLSFQTKRLLSRLSNSLKSPRARSSGSPPDRSTATHHSLSSLPMCHVCSPTALTPTPCFDAWDDVPMRASRAS